MKNILFAIVTLSIGLLSCEKDNNIDETNNQKEEVKVVVEGKDVSHYKHAIYTKLEDGKLVVFFSQFDLKNYYDIKINTENNKKGIKLPNQLFYLGVFPATEGIFPDLSKYQIGAINYTNLKFNFDLSISEKATQKYTATHVIIDATTPPIELGKYNINIDYLAKDSIITGSFNGVMAKIDLETKLPDPNALPLSTSGTFENVGYIDIEEVKEYLPIDIGSLF